MIKKVVIPAAGLGTRLLPATKEQPKEMLPIFSVGQNGQMYVKPLLQLVFEQLYGVGIREFCFITGKTKRAIEDHFTSDNSYITMLRDKQKGSLADSLDVFYKSLRDASVMWVNQPEPKGFGDAVHCAKQFVGDDEFLVHAGDTYIISKDNHHIKRLAETHDRLGSDATLIVQRMRDPRMYGVIRYERMKDGVYKVTEAIEKPKVPPTDLAIMPVYIFRPIIFRALEKVGPGRGGELQLTDAVQMLVGWGSKVHAIELEPEEIRLDIGTPEMYWEAVRMSFEYAAKASQKSPKPKSKSRSRS
ncbi:MAG: UTP--glucose-1-phosphate uridylyltransferase [Candidatus Bathyarchaeia archaeon]